MTESKFWKNYHLFAGGEGELFLDCVLFRKYLDKFFKGGTSALASCQETHWVYYYEGELYDSVEDDHQPEIDHHCTLFSFYYQLFFSRFRTCLDLQGLEEVTTQKKYIDNLIEIYSALSKAFRNEEIIEYIHRFKPWKRYGKFLVNDCYSLKADENIRILIRLRKTAKNEKPYYLFA